jgi:lysophospholipase L1-like esterase
MNDPNSADGVPETVRYGRFAAAHRVGRLMAGGVAVVASLLTFPAGIPAMIAFWIACHCIQLARGRPGWLPLTTCLVAVLVKRVPWFPTLALLLAVMALAAGAGPVSKRCLSAAAQRKLKLGLVAAVWLTWIGFAWDWRRSGQANHSVAAWDQRPVVCIGDSLTSYPPRRGYPKVLARLVTAPVVNLGQPGVTSAEALARLPELSALEPQAVVIELGGHDYLKDASWLPTDSRAEVKRNLERFITAARKQGAEVFLMEIPRGFIVDPYAGLERELAREHDLELISDTAIRNLVLWSPACPPGLWTGGPYLSDDGLHPNAHGDEYLAAVVAHSLARLYGPQILRPAQ